MKIRTAANGMSYWGTRPLPFGSRCLGVVEYNNKIGALIDQSGVYKIGIGGRLADLPQEQVTNGLQQSAVMSGFGKIKSPARAAASAENGKRGGRPRTKER